MQEFSAKRDAIFACLDNASKELKGTGLDQSNSTPYTLNALERGLITRQEKNESPERNIEIYSNNNTDVRLKRMRGKESIFKKPELPIGRCLKPRKTPDYQVNPHKWKKYSLSDVDISEQTNSAAALSFLRQMDAQRDAEEETAVNMDADQKIEFNKSSKLNRNLRQTTKNEVDDLEVDKPQLRGSKLIMPEYVIGQKKPSSRQHKKLQTKTQSRPNATLSLSHLDETDDIDE